MLGRAAGTKTTLLPDVDELVGEQRLASLSVERTVVLRKDDGVTRRKRIGLEARSRVGCFG